MAWLRHTLVGLALAAAAQSPAGAQEGAAPTGVRPEVRAQLVPVEATVLAAQMSGKIERLDIRDGQRFEEGEILVAYDCAEQRAERAVTAANRVRAAKVYENRRRLNQLQGIAAIELEIASADLAQANAELQLRDVLLQRCEVPAPSAGVAGEVSARAHQYVAEGDPLLEVIDDRTFEVEMLLPSVWLRGLEVGQAFQLELDETGQVYDAEIVRLSGRIDPVSQSVKAYGRVTAPGPDLKAGMSGRALFPAAP
jgi:RND family efflux transporter MFP subunit